MRSRHLDDLSEEDLRRLLVEKGRDSRAARLDRFLRTGRVTQYPQEEPSESRVHLEESVVRHGRGMKNKSKSWADQFLLGVEGLALIGLLAMLLTGLMTLRSINRVAAAAFLPPALTPTPLIMAVVLPEGHTPPNSPNGAQPNEAEIPAHLRPLVQSLANLPTPMPDDHQAIRIQIPAIGVDAPVVQGDGWEQLKRGVAQHIGTPDPGEKGNMVLSGHNDVFGEVFRDLDQLKPGDVIFLYTSERQFTYLITGTQLVEPTDVEVMAPTPNATVTLISCYPYLVDNQRIIVSAVLQNP